MDSYNWSYHSIAGAYMLGIAPHAYYLANIMKTGKHSNQMPRDSLHTLRGVIPANLWSKLFRARSAHINAIEGFPLFAAAMIAGNAAKLPTSDLNLIAAEYIGSRVLYTALYMGARSEFMSYVRTGVWFWGIGLPLYTLIKAGNAFSNDI
ncbi:hypothetical protein FQN49_004097 [Arthroderma sp. PD_2]|nr:hypothetical protein FQN49_004097 [Arthroderma sp. PD_2]